MGLAPSFFDLTLTAKQYKVDGSFTERHALSHYLPAWDPGCLSHSIAKLFY